jgi:peptide/nickel transport system permease protein
MTVSANLASAAGPARPGFAATRPTRGPMVNALIGTVRSPGGATGVVLLLGLSLVALLAPVLAPYSSIQQHPGRELLGPNREFLLGTDEFGRDLLSRLMWGGRISFTVAALAVIVGSGIGIATGLLAGYHRGLVDVVMMRMYDVVLTFPNILVAIAVVSIIGPGATNVAWALAVALTPAFARLTRASVLRERESEYVMAARALGLSDFRIMWGHIFPNTLAPLLIETSLALGGAVILESSLAFLGLGAQPPEASWGNMLSTSRAYLRVAPLYGVFPGLCLMLLIFGLNSMSDALRDALDPRRWQKHSRGRTERYG